MVLTHFYYQYQYKIVLLNKTRKVINMTGVSFQNPHKMAGKTRVVIGGEVKQKKGNKRKASEASLVDAAVPTQPLDMDFQDFGEINDQQQDFNMENYRIYRAYDVHLQEPNDIRSSCQIHVLQDFEEDDTLQIKRSKNKYAVVLIKKVILF
jgi:hypothetical protein